MKPRLFSSHAASAALSPRCRPGPGGVAAATACAVAALAAVPAFGQVAVTLNGPPVQVRPYVPEPGLPNVTIPLGTLNPFPSDPSGGGSPGDPGGGGSPGNVAPSDALSTMLSQPWGIAAVSAVQSLGVNPSAIAATCVVESGCQNLSGGTYTGAFQMGSAAFNEGLQTALAANPNLASQIVQGSAGMTDPVTEAIAAPGYQMEAVQKLQAAGISNPTFLDTRPFYNFGPANAVAMATANPDLPVSEAMPGVSAATLQKNEITPGETVGQWRASVAAKVGTAANQSVMGT